MLSTKPTGGRTKGTPVIHGGRKVPGLSVRATADGETVYDVRAKRGGKNHYGVVRAATTTEAIRLARDWTTDLDRKLADPGAPAFADLTLPQLQPGWGEWATEALSARTKQLYEEKLPTVIRILGADTPVSAITVRHVRRLIRQLTEEGKSGVWVRHALGALSSLLRHAIRIDALERSPMDGLVRGDRPSSKSNKKPRRLNREQLAALLSGLPDQYRPVAWTYAFAALRASEALDLRWSHVDFERGLLHVPGTKTEGSAATVPLVSDLARELRAHRAREAERGFDRIKADALVFQTRTGQPQCRHNVARALRRAADRAGLNPEGVKPVSPHDLRHTCLSLLIESGVPITDVSAVARHANVRITAEIYAGQTEGRAELLRDAIEAAFAAAN